MLAAARVETDGTNRGGMREVERRLVTTFRKCIPNIDDHLLFFVTNLWCCSASKGHTASLPTGGGGGQLSQYLPPVHVAAGLMPLQELGRPQGICRRCCIVQNSVRVPRRRVVRAKIDILINTIRFLHTGTDA